MSRNPPAGPHAAVAERFAFLLESLELDRESFSAAVDGAVSPRSLFAILSGDRRPSRSLAVLIERTFGFRADHLLDGTGPMWVRGDRGDADADLGGLTPVEQRAVEFARRSVDNARALEDELDRAEAWESMWGRATVLLAELERVARSPDAEAYPLAATATLDECWAMADAFAAWSEALDQRRVSHLTRLFVQRFLGQVPGELADRGVIGSADASLLRDRTDQVLRHLAEEADALDRHLDGAAQRLADLTAAPTDRPPRGDLAAQLAALADSIDRRRPSAR